MYRRKNTLSVDPFFGFIDDIADKSGVWRAEEFLPGPKELFDQIGLPTPEDVVPSPREIGVELSRALPKLPIVMRPPTKKLLMAPAKMIEQVSPF